MKQGADKSFSFKAAFNWCFVALFLPILILGFTSSIFAGTCQRPEIDAERKARACSISITTGFLNTLIASEEKKLAMLYLERGIALSHLDRSQEAIKDFRLAIEKATGITLAELAQRIEANEDFLEFFQTRTGKELTRSPLSGLEPSSRKRFEGLILRLISEEPTSKAWSNWEKLLKEA
ncbi:hypothetical protein SAMN04488518_101524 [Pseudovibrio ascidiaceicola]|uniref:Tetratricopeptide repeat-containing protein n=1 Tax=Pseudovibrio ascidiaceicola TaxID=285279 RepID=A0A1I3VPV1_9HYPH|nr:hypothetical protein [Pseudovibrio ascidiaceicola]SFJ96973.1 hypothetical protein SAMN04488518_101524 [Pseudovibrio ascidiaceicola]